MNNELTVSDILQIVNEGRILVACHSGFGGTKTILAKGSGGFEVIHNRVVVLECMQAHEALAKYNSITIPKNLPMKLIDFKMKVDLEQYEIAQEILSKLGYNNLSDVVKQSKLNDSNSLWLISEDGKLFYDPFVADPSPTESRELTFMQFLVEVNKREYQNNLESF